MDHHSAMTGALNARIQSFTTFEEMVEDATVKTVAGSVVAILTLVRVRFFAQFLPTYSLNLSNDRNRVS